MRTRLLCLGVFLAASLRAATACGQDVLVVAPKELQPALAAWKTHREKQGHAVAFREPGADVRATILAAHKESGGKLRFVLLAGDVDLVPCAYRDVETIRQWEKDTRIATDGPYGDVDGDGLPDLAVGRVPIDVPAELEAYAARVVASEETADAGDWRRRLSVIASPPGFDSVKSAILEQHFKQLLTKDIPPEYVVGGAYASPLSAWCPPPAEFAATVKAEFARGALVVAYAGQGDAHTLGEIHWGDDGFPILGRDEVAQLECLHGPPLTVLLGCSNGQFDGEQDSVAEQMLRRPRGPVAVIASSRHTSAYCVGILAREMFMGLFREKAATAGELLVTMKRRLAAPSADDEERRALERIAATIYNPDDAVRAVECREHVAVFNLLGDPCVPIPRPDALTIAAPATVLPGAKVEVTGTAPAVGKLVVEVARRRDSATPVGSRATVEEWRETYRRSLALEVGRTETTVAAGPFRVTVEVAADAKAGPGCVRAWFEGGGVCAAGGLDVTISRAAPADSTPPK